MVADHQRRAPRDARAGRDGRPRRRSRSSTSRAPAPSTTSRGSSSRQMDVPVGRSCTRRCCTRPAASSRTSRSCGWRTTVPRGDRRRHGHARQEVVRRPPAGRRLGPDPGPDVRACARSGSGVRGRATSSRRRPRDDVSNEGFPFGTVKTIELGGVRALASRISYVGELGWEIYAPMEQGLRLWDTLWEAGQAFGVVPVGIGVYATTGRLEKGYRAHGNELELEYDLVEAGMTRPKVKERPSSGGRLPRPAVEAAGRDPVHADPGRPDVTRPASRATCSARSRSSRSTGGRSPTPRAAART